MVVTHIGLMKTSKDFLGSNLRCRVQIDIDENGKINNVQIVNSSGNNRFDEDAKKTVRDKDPVPPLSPFDKDVYEKIKPFKIWFSPNKITTII